VAKTTIHYLFKKITITPRVWGHNRVTALESRGIPGTHREHDEYNDNNLRDLQKLTRGVNSVCSKDSILSDQPGLIKALYVMAKIP
jgi:hypothetical protein